MQIVKILKKSLLIGLGIILIIISPALISFGQEPDPNVTDFFIYLPDIAKDRAGSLVGEPIVIPTITPAPPIPVELSELPITFPVQSPELATFFSEVARSEDMAGFPSQYIHLLMQISAGQKRADFASWAEAQQNLDDLGDSIDVVGYNPEHWDQTPIEEQNNLAATVQQAAQDAHAFGLKFLLAPDRKFVDEQLSELVPHVDIFVLQGQRLQDDPVAFEAWISEQINIARTINPNVKIFVQISASRGPALEMLTAIKKVEQDIDGIAIWSIPSSFENLKEFISLIREDIP